MGSGGIALDWDELLAELFGKSAEEALPGLEELGLIVGETLFDVIHALDHDAPEEDGELMGQGLVGDEAAAARGHPPVIAAEGDVFAARRARAMTRRDCPARLRRRLTAALRLPLWALPGASPGDEAKRFSVGHLVRSVPTSPTSCRTVYSLSAGSVVASVPAHMRWSRCRRLAICGVFTPGRVQGFAGCSTRAAGASPPGIRARTAAILRSQSTICAWSWSQL